MSGRIFRIELSRRAARSLRVLAADVAGRIERRIDALARDPRPRGARKLSGEDELYRLRIGDYRVLYQVRDRVLVVLVVDVGHRREVYRR